MTYPESIEFLYRLSRFGTKLGLANSINLAALAGNPQEKLRFIHVAGTNGKGSTCAMLESIYRTAGLKTGMFTSPHLVAFGERIQVNRKLISEAEIAGLVQQIQPLLSHFPSEAQPTFFEVVTVMALRYFAEQQCKIVIWETGLGGRLDATNIVNPLASVITNIQFDHQQWLGDTLSKIASEKAGIFKRGIPALTGTDVPEALEVLVETAQRLNAPLEVVTEKDVSRPPLDSIQLPLAGWHQRKNAALALATVRVLQAQIPVTTEAIRAGLGGVRWAGRLQLITRTDGRRILLDGAHNPGGVQTLVDALQQYYPSAKPAVILGVLQDKDWTGICNLIAPVAGKILLVPVSSERTLDPEVLRNGCQRANPDIEVVVCNSVAAALKKARDEQFILVTGSLFLIGEALEELQEGNVSGERGLNEWLAAKI